MSSIVAAIVNAIKPTAKKVEAEKPNDLKNSKLEKAKDLTSAPKLEKANDLLDTGATKRKRSVVEAEKDLKKPAVSAGTKPVADDKKAVAKPISEEKDSKRQCQRS
jgi:hypothetical protein